MVDPKLDGKVVVITGANNPHGIGAGAAKAFAAQGTRVFLHYFRPGSKNTKIESSPHKASSPGEAFYCAQQRKPPDEVLQAVRELGGHGHISPFIRHSRE